MQNWKNKVTNMKAHRDGVILRILKEPPRTAGGLYVPPEVDRRTEQGKVMSVGPDVTMLKAGDIVLFDKYIGMGLGEDYLITKEADIIARLEGTEGGDA